MCRLGSFSMHMKYVLCLPIKQRMDSREWMYTGWTSPSHMTDEWVSNTMNFLELAFARVKRDVALCPCANARTHENRTRPK